MIKQIILVTLFINMFGCAYRENPPAPISDGVAQFAVNTDSTTKSATTTATNATDVSSNNETQPTKITKLSRMNNQDSNKNFAKTQHKPAQISAEKQNSTITSDDNDDTTNEKSNSMSSTSRDGWMMPLKGEVSGKFSQAKKGIDIKAPVGSVIDAASDGKVVYSGNGLKGYGNLIIIRHDNGYLTAYAQNKTNLVKVGQDVKVGDKIAEVGNGGVLHFELRKNGKPINPVDYISGK